MSSKSRSVSTKKVNKKDDATFLERLPSNVPFLPYVRRPDFQLRYTKISAPSSIPIELIIAIVFLGLLFIYIGGFYDLAQTQISAFGASGDDPLVIYPGQLDEQFLVEGMAAGLLMFIGAGGFFLIYYSTQYAYSPKNSTILLILGIGVVVIAWVPIMYMFLYKMRLWGA